MSVELSPCWDEENLLPFDFYKTIENPPIPGCAGSVDTWQFI